MIKAVLLESLWMLVGSWLVVQFMLVAWWSWMRSQRAGRAVCGGFAALPLLVCLSMFVSTARERIIERCHALCEAVDDGDMIAIETCLADDFMLGDMDRAQFIDRASSTLSRYKIDALTISRFRVETNAGEGVAEFSTVCGVRSAQQGIDRLPSRWRIRFLERSGAWRVTHIASVPVAPLFLRNERDWLR